MVDTLASSAPFDLKLDRRAVAFGMDNPNPNFSWRIPTDTHQSAYQIRLLNGDGHVVWTGEETPSSATIDIPYKGPKLNSFSRYQWQVRNWQSGTPSPWSTAQAFETAMLLPGEWTAKWIGGKPKDPSALYLWGRINLPAGVLRARAYVSALGWYRFLVNGIDQTGNALVPRWTPLDHIVEYQVYDVTESLQAGANALAMAIADGRYRGHTGYSDRREIYGDTLAGIIQVRIENADGTIQTFGTDTDWLAGSGQILTSDPKRGEYADLRISASNWHGASLPPKGFEAARRVTPPSQYLVAEEVERVEEIGRLKPQRVWRAPSGKLLVDFGQNLAGVMRLRVDAPTGTRITIAFSELVGRDGELDLKYLMGKMPTDPPQRDTVISSGRAEWWQPWFSIHGFRYAEIDGLAGEPQPDDFEAIVLSTALDYRGNFSCSDETLNRLVDNVRWSMKSNFVDTPTDCPTRERSGWTGDIQVFSQTATLLADVQPYLRRYLRNLALDQCENGAIPAYIPADASRFAGKQPWVVRPAVNSAGWGDASVMVPYNLYMLYGDRKLLERQYDSMCRWVDHLASLAHKYPGRGRLFPRLLPRGLGRYIVDSGYHWGEWLRPGEDMVLTSIKHRLTAPSVVATAYLANSARLLAEIAETLGRSADALRYAGLAAKVREAWNLAFVRDGARRIGDDRQDDYVRALAFDLLPEDQRAAALARLVALIEANGDRLGTGFLSTPMLLPVLTRFGRSDIAYRLMLQRRSPSWLYPVERGATTTWESWEGYDKNGDGRYSHNHYAFGTVLMWLFGSVAGITALEPGYRRIKIAPVIGGGLAHANAEIETPYGMTTSAWRRSGNQIDLDVEIPPGTGAEIHLGDGRIEAVGSGSFSFTWILSDVAMKADLLAAKAS